eukprot:scaffold7340_cov266-Pinguiococcus_pyrenoidosus.AAC.12
MALVDSGVAAVVDMVAKVSIRVKGGGAHAGEALTVRKLPRNEAKPITECVPHEARRKLSPKTPRSVGGVQCLGAGVSHPLHEGNALGIRPGQKVGANGVVQRLMDGICPCGLLHGLGVFRGWCYPLGRPDKRKRRPCRITGGPRKCPFSPELGFENGAAAEMNGHGPRVLLFVDCTIGEYDVAPGLHPGRVPLAINSSPPPQQLEDGFPALARKSARRPRRPYFTVHRTLADSSTHLSTKQRSSACFLLRKSTPQTGMRGRFGENHVNAWLSARSIDLDLDLATLRLKCSGPVEKLLTCSPDRRDDGSRQRQLTERQPKAEGRRVQLQGSKIQRGHGIRHLQKALVASRKLLVGRDIPKHDQPPGGDLSTLMTADTYDAGAGADSSMPYIWLTRIGSAEVRGRQVAP